MVGINKSAGGDLRSSKTLDGDIRAASLLSAYLCLPRLDSFWHVDIVNSVCDERV